MVVTRDDFQIYDRETERFLMFIGWPWSSIDWVGEQYLASVHPRARCASLVADPIAREHHYNLIVVSAANCGCCGVSLGRYGWLVSSARLVEDQYGPQHRVWRCEKHIGRLPCIIEGCGRTFALESDDSYWTRTICGRHWRQAPKFMRDAVSRVRKQANRRKGPGWTPKMRRRVHRLWNRCVRAVINGQTLDMTAINKEFGWTND